MIEWVLIMTIEADIGREVQQYAIDGFKTEKACMKAGSKIGMAAGNTLRSALAGKQKSDRTVSYPICVEIDKE